jgi:hypothetical protein
VFLPKYDAARAHPDRWLAGRRVTSGGSAVALPPKQSVISLSANGRPYRAQVVVDLSILPETCLPRLR